MPKTETLDPIPDATWQKLEGLDLRHMEARIRAAGAEVDTARIWQMLRGTSTQPEILDVLKEYSTLHLLAFLQHLFVETQRIRLEHARAEPYDAIELQRLLDKLSCLFPAVTALLAQRFHELQFPTRANTADNIQALVAECVAHTEFLTSEDAGPHPDAERLAAELLREDGPPYE